MDNPITAVWEITMGCNMRCKHCGSSCAKPLPEELNTAEALALCEDIGDLGLKWITLSGGEPLIRQDWPQLVRALRARGVIPNMITNGWMCTEEIIDTAKDAGIGTFAVSLDGPRDVHDFIRREGAFDRAIIAMKTMAAKGIDAGAITTVQRRNIDRLEEIYDTLHTAGVEVWQLQIGLPMGNLGHGENIDMVLPPESIDRIIDFIHQHSTDPDMSIFPADCLGYYSVKEIEARTRANRSDEPISWIGCNAGKRSFGILHNGDILGCTSIRDRSFIEGNIRERPLAEIWHDPEKFAWSRTITKKQLSGRCAGCGYGDVCLGGCPNTRLTMHQSIYAENDYCSYNLALGRAEAILDTVSEASELHRIADGYLQEGEYQLAALAFERYLQRQPNDIAALGSYGFASYALRNFETARKINERALELAPDDIYATKGLGVVLHSMGQSDAGIAMLRHAVELADRKGAADAEVLDSYHDLAVVFLQSGRKDEARAVLERVRDIAPAFATSHPELYQAAE